MFKLTPTINTIGGLCTGGWWVGEMVMKIHECILLVQPAKSKKHTFFTRTKNKHYLAGCNGAMRVNMVSVMVKMVLVQQWHYAGSTVHLLVQPANTLLTRNNKKNL